MTSLILCVEFADKILIFAVLKQRLLQRRESEASFCFWCFFHLEITRLQGVDVGCLVVGSVKISRPIPARTITLSWISICRRRPAPDAENVFNPACVSTASIDNSSSSRLDLLLTAEWRRRPVTTTTTTMNVQPMSDTDDGDAAELSKLTGTYSTLWKSVHRWPQSWSLYLTWLDAVRSTVLTTVLGAITFEVPCNGMICY